MARHQKNTSRTERRRTATRRPGPHLAVVREQHAPAPERALPADPTAELADLLIAAVARSRTALGAEIVVSKVLGEVELGVDEDLAATAVRELVAGVVEHAEGVGTPDALATLRVCASLAPRGCRALAAEAAGRVAARGIPDRPWAPRVGRPEVLRAWACSDIFGNQSSFGVLFTDRGRDHALMVLLDHELGGGVKDAFVAEGRQAGRLRDLVMSGLSEEPMSVFKDIDTATAATSLREGLAHPPCPVEEDQVEDVPAHLALVRSRVERLAELAGLPAVDEDAVRGGRADDAAGDAGVTSPPVPQLHVPLRGLRLPD